MRFPLTDSQALIICRIINKETIKKRETKLVDMAILAQTSSIKMTSEGLIVTKTGKKRFLKFAKKQGVV